MKPWKHLTLRWLGLIGIAALVLHEVRYYAAYGDRTPRALADQGHSYLPLIGVLVVLLLVIVLVRLGRALTAALRGITVDPRPPRFGRLWAYSSSALMAVYCIQEGVEGHLSAGHPGGLLGIFGNGGWTAILLALAFGALIAALLHAVDATVRVLAQRPLAKPRPRPAGDPLPVRCLLPSPDVLALNLAARAPPNTS
jgi:hypothetical protein